LRFRTSSADKYISRERDFDTGDLGNLVAMILKLDLERIAAAG
jgi:hypothetical protein